MQKISCKQFLSLVYSKRLEHIPANGNLTLQLSNSLSKMQVRSDLCVKWEKDRSDLC